MEISKRFCSELTGLTANLDADTFKDDLLRVLNRLIGIKHFAVFVFDQNHIEDLTASMVEGDKKDKAVLSKNAELFVEKLKQHMWLDPEQLLDFNKGKQEEYSVVHRYNPDKDTDIERKQLYKKTRTSEKFFMVVSRNNKIYITNFFRGLNLIGLPDHEFEELKPVFSLINNLIILRHEMIGESKGKHREHENMASLFKERGLEPFIKLSNRETEVCDRILKGMTAEAIADELQLAVSSVSTLRKRAYNKIGISSRSQLFALVMNSHF